MLTDSTRKLLQTVQDGCDIIRALKVDRVEAIRRLDMILSEDERELIEVFHAAYPNLPLTADERDSRDGGGRAGETLSSALLGSVPHQ